MNDREQRIVDLLRTNGPMTTKQIADIIGMRPSDLSTKMKNLAKYRFVVHDGYEGPHMHSRWRAVE